MGTILFWAGVVIYLVGMVWLIYLAWTNNQTLWAVGIFCLGPIVGTIYGVMNFDESKIPLGILWVGFILQIVGRVIPSG